MSKNNPSGARREVPRSRGALSGIALIVLGLWGALIPFVGPYFNFSFTPDKAWHWTAARGWLEVLPGAAALVAGLLLLASKSRMMTLIAAWLGILAGAWFAVGPQLQSVWHIGSPGRPAGSSTGLHVLEVLALFTLLGVVIVYFAATAFGRLSVVSLRDARAAERREAAAAAHEHRAAGHDDHADTATDDHADTATDVRADTATDARADTATDASADTAAGGSGSHPVTQDSGQGAPAAQTQQAPSQPAQPQQPVPSQTGQGYAQPQHYDPQHGYARPTPEAEPGQADTQQEGLGRRLFHRR